MKHHLDTLENPLPLIEYLRTKKCQDNFIHTIEFLENQGWSQDSIYAFLLTLGEEYNIKCDCELVHNLEFYMDCNQEIISLEGVNKLIKNRLPEDSRDFSIKPSNKPNRMIITNKNNDHTAEVPLFAISEVIKALNSLI